MKKLELRGALEAAYDHGDRLALRELAVTTIPAAMAALDELDAAFRRNWLACAKAHGLERSQVRKAGQMARLEELSLRIREYLDGTIERTVNYGSGAYTTEASVDGMGFGLMYEVGRVYALDEDGDTCLQPVFNIAYRHAGVGSFDEENSDAALSVESQSVNTVTLGLGARLQTVVGENMFNRTSILELRAMAKLDVGDTTSETDVALINGTGKGRIESAELGAFGGEVGLGLHIPVGDENDGTIFVDVSAEFRSGYTNVNGVLGYRINF